MANSLKELLQDLRVLPVFEPGKTKGQSGIWLDGYLYFNRVVGYPELSKKLAYHLGDLIYKNSPDVTCIAAPELADALIAKDISTTWSIPLTVIKKKPKAHGIKTLVEGYMPTVDDKVAVFTDVCTTGGSARRSIAALKPTGAQITAYFTILKRGEPSINPFYYLYEESDFL